MNKPTINDHPTDVADVVANGNVTTAVAETAAVAATDGTAAVGINPDHDVASTIMEVTMHDDVVVEDPTEHRHLADDNSGMIVDDAVVAAATAEVAITATAPAMETVATGPIDHNDGVGNDVEDNNNVALSSIPDETAVATTELIHDRTEDHQITTNDDGEVATADEVAEAVAAAVGDVSDVDRGNTDNHHQHQEMSAVEASTPSGEVDDGDHPPHQQGEHHHHPHHQHDEQHSDVDVMHDDAELHHHHQQQHQHHYDASEHQHPHYPHLPHYPPHPHHHYPHHPPHPHHAAAAAAHHWNYHPGWTHPAYMPAYYNPHHHQQQQPHEDDQQEDSSPITRAGGSPVVNPNSMNNDDDTNNDVSNPDDQQHRPSTLPVVTAETAPPPPENQHGKEQQQPVPLPATNEGVAAAPTATTTIFADSGAGGWQGDGDSSMSYQQDGTTITTTTAVEGYLGPSGTDSTPTMSTRSLLEQEHVQNMQAALLQNSDSTAQQYHYATLTTLSPTVNPREYQEFLAWQQARAQHDAEMAAEQLHMHSAKTGTTMTTSNRTRKRAANMSTVSGGRYRKTNKKKTTDASDAARSLMLLTDGLLLTKEDGTPIVIDAPWADMVADAVFVCPALRGDISDALYIALAQFRPVGLTQDDRVGKYKTREIGFVGMCCVYCGGQPGFGRYFPGSYDSFLNGTNCEGIIKHIKAQCRSCPDNIRTKVSDLEQIEPNPAATRPRYGARKRFFSYVWNKLRTAKINNSATTATSTKTGVDNGTADGGEEGGDGNSNSKDKAPPDIGGQIPTDEQEASIPMAIIVKDSEVVSISDRHLVSDTTLVAMAQMKICYVTDEDKIGRCKDHDIGFKGLCCKHCGGKAGKPGYGRYFPSSLRSLAQADSCQQIVKHINSKCVKCPPEVRAVILEIGNMEKAARIRIRYGSRKIFFRRVWQRLHGKSAGENTPGTTIALPHEEMADTTGEGETPVNQTLKPMPNAAAAPPITLAEEDIPWERIIGNSEVVSISDRGLISDAQLAAIAQMNMTKLTEADRVGWFKNRELGYGGLCCRHCGGRPSFGRYFPNSVRSFAQTTSSQTIISHIAMYCPDVPQDIRDVVLTFQRSENASDGNTAMSSSMYGSRKVFFDRVWQRMHNTQPDVAAEVVHELPPQVLLAIAPQPQQQIMNEHPAVVTTEAEHSTTTVDPSILIAATVGGEGVVGGISAATGTTVTAVSTNNDLLVVNDVKKHEEHEGVAVPFAQSQILLQPQPQPVTNPVAPATDESNATGEEEAATAVNQHPPETTQTDVCEMATTMTQNLQQQAGDENTVTIGAEDSNDDVIVASHPQQQGILFDVTTTTAAVEEQQQQPLIGNDNNKQPI